MPPYTSINRAERLARNESRAEVLRTIEKIREETRKRYGDARDSESVPLEARIQFYSDRLVPFFATLKSERIKTREELVNHERLKQKLRAERDERESISILRQVQAGSEDVASDKRDRIDKMIKLLNDNNYDVVEKAVDRVLDVNWTAPENIRRLFKRSKNPLSLEVLQKDGKPDWSESGVAEMLQRQFNAFERIVKEKTQAIEDGKVTMGEKDGRLTKMEDELCGIKKSLKKAEEERDAALASKARGPGERGRSKSKSRASSSRRGQSTGGDDDEEDDEDNEDDEDEEDDEKNEEIKDLRKMTNKLSTDLRIERVKRRAAKTEIITLNSELDRWRQIALRIHVYGVHDTAPRIREACAMVLQKIGTEEIKKPFAGFHDVKGVALAHQFDDTPHLPKGLPGRLGIETLLAIISQYSSEATTVNMVMGHLAWLNAMLDDIYQIEEAREFLAMDQFLKPVNCLQLNPLGTTLRNIAVASIASRNEDLDSYFQDVSATISILRETEGYEWEFWPCPEKLSFLWFRALYGIWPEWLSKEGQKYKLWTELNPAHIGDFVDILQRSVAFVEREDNASMYVLSGSDHYTNDKMVVLRFKQVTFTFGNDFQRAEEWHDWVWVRHNNKVSLSLKPLNVKVEVVKKQQLWSVQSSLSTQWFKVEEEKFLEYLDAHYLEQLQRETYRLLDAE
jgi:hypothetical protein